MNTYDKLEKAKKAWKLFRKNNNVSVEKVKEEFGLDHKAVRKLAILAAANAEDSFIQAFELLT